ncbi:MAG: hypothetical protein C4548_01870 [Desulfobacteraceae bacterium]|nr:MAG: hypothetical protein C4548_01870 [Desulfobacteraceae bacterium]
MQVLLKINCIVCLRHICIIFKYSFGFFCGDNDYIYFNTELMERSCFEHGARTAERLEAVSKPDLSF